MSQQHVRLVLLGLVWLCASLGYAAVSDERGLFYGNPTSGSIQFAGLSSGGQSYFAETYVSHPTAVALYNNRVYFGNVEPLSKQPWISSAPVSGNEKATLFTQNDTPTGVYIGDMAIDSDYQSGSLFFLYRAMDQNSNRASKYHRSLDVILTQPFDSTTSTATAVYAMNNGTVPPNSIALDTANEIVYFSSNGLVNKGQRSNGGIYKVPYTGGEAEQVLVLPQLAQMNSYIASLKFYNNHLYYILNTVSDQTVRKVDVNTGDSTVICDHLSFTPAEIELDVNNGEVTMWIRDSQGKFYRASESDCTPAASFTVPHVLDFVFESVSKQFYSVNSDVAAVLSYPTTGQTSAVVSGIGEDTNIWVDGANRMLYYSTYNRIDSFTIEDSPTWSQVFKLEASDRVGDLTGDEITGDLIIATNNAIMSWSPREEQPTYLLTLHATSMTVWNSTLYYATNVSDSYSLMRCNLNGCNPSTTQSVVSGVAKSIDTVSVAEDGSIFYGTTDGLFTSNGTVVVPYLATISPYAMTLNDKTLTYLDINGNQVIIGTCDIDDCQNTLTTSTAHFTPTTRVELYAFMERDTHGMVYWSTSLAPGVIYQFDSTNATANITRVWSDTLPGTRVRGMSLAENGETLYVSINTDAWRYPTNDFGMGGQVCVQGQNLTVSALEVYGGSLFWSDALTGSVFQCRDDCTGCFNSTRVNNGSFTCSNWQTLSVQKKLIYEQMGCGGVVRVAYNASQAQPQTLRPEGQYPFTDMVTGDKGLIAFAVPFRATIIRSTAGATALQRSRTVLSGTGLFTNLVVDQSTGSNTYYWNDPTSRKLLVSQDGSVSDLSLEFAFALSPYVPTILPSRSPSPSMSVQPSPEPSASVSASPSASGSISTTSTATTSGSVSPSVSVTMSTGASQSPSPSETPSGSVSASVTMTPSSVSPSVSLSVSSSASSSVGVSTNETSPAASPSASVSATVSMSFGMMPSVSPSPSFLPFLNNSASNTPGLANMTEPVVSPLISTTGWEWISLISLFLIVCVILPCSYCTWKNNVEQEMAMSLRLP